MKISYEICKSLILKFCFFLIFFIYIVNAAEVENIEITKMISETEYFYVSNYNRHSYPDYKYNFFQFNIYIPNLTKFYNIYLYNKHYLTYILYKSKFFFYNNFILLENNSKIVNNLQLNTYTEYVKYFYNLNKNIYIESNWFSLKNINLYYFKFDGLVKDSSYFLDNREEYSKYLNTRIKNNDIFGSLVFFEKNLQISYINIVLSYFFISFVFLINFIFYYFLNFLIFFIFFYIIFIYLFIYKQHSFYGRMFDIYLAEEDDDYFGSVDLLKLYREMERKEKYYNIIKFENNLFQYILTRNKQIYKWYNSLDIKNYTQYFQLEFNNLSNIYTKVDVIHWCYEEFSDDTDDWYYIPYDMLKPSFNNSKYYFENFSSNEILEIDKAYDGFDFYQVDVYGFKKYEYIIHPFKDSNEFEVKETNLGYNNFNFNPESFFKRLNYDENVLLNAADRYSKIYNIYINKNKSFDSLVEYNGTSNTLYEIYQKSNDTTLNLINYEWKLYEKDVSYYLFFDEEFQEYEGYIAPSDYRYKVVPTVWKHFSFSNFLTNIIFTSLGQYLIRSEYFWEEYNEFPEADTYEEDRKIFSYDSKIYSKMNDIDKNLPFMYGYGFGRFGTTEGTIEAYHTVFNNLTTNHRRYSSEYMYPPYKNNIGGHLVPLEYRFLKGYDFFYLNYLKNLNLSDIKNNSLNNLNYNKGYQHKLLDTTYFISNKGFPLGYSFSTPLYSEDSLYKNNNIQLNNNYDYFDIEDKDYKVAYEQVEDMVEVIFMSFVLPLFILIIII